MIVPDSIKFVKALDLEKSKGSDGIGILAYEDNGPEVFGNRCIISDDKGNYSVSTSFGNEIKCKLIKVLMEDLKVGHTYFRGFDEDVINTSIEEHRLYCKWGGDNYRIFQDNITKGALREDVMNTFWKVVPLEGEEL